MWFAQAPSNIALIKYMGKADEALNLPLNASLSYTLDNLLSFVELSVSNEGKDTWEHLQIPGTGQSQRFELSEAGQQRFIKHLQYMKSIYNYEGHFLIRSCNNFPSGAGLASSASSFAALTKCAAIALAELTGRDEMSVDTMAQHSRVGSGSSCRSFYSPWALWDNELVKEQHFAFDKLIHKVILISKEEKSIASSEAHRLVQTSPQYVDRKKRADDNFTQCIAALKDGDWSRLYDVCWREFMDMHDLFKTSETPFNYINDDAKQVLEDLQRYWQQHNDGPVVTMDAGPNIHLLFRPEQEQLANDLNLFLLKDHDIL